VVGDRASDYHLSPISYHLPAVRPRSAISGTGLVVRIRIPIPIRVHDATREHQVTGEPATAIALPQHIVTDTVARGRRVNDSIVADVDRDVIDVIAVVREEEQIAWTESARTRRDRITEIRHASSTVW